MQFGKLRHTLELQDFTKSKDAHGHTIRSYTTFATVKGDVRGQYGTESVYAERVESRMIHRIVIRYRNDVTPQQRIIWKSNCDGDRTLEIQSVMDMRGDRRMLTILATEVKT